MSRFKTELCNNLIELGNCKYGDRCHYAHGVHELRQVSRRHPKYRTERCKNFELTGKCPFGPRCSYVHPKPDLDSMIEQLTKYMKHTKAPKPDSECDDNEEENNVNLFSSASATRLTNSNNTTRSPTISITSSNSLITTTNDIYEENKENQLVVVNDHDYDQVSTLKSTIYESTTTSFETISSNKKPRLISNHNSSSMMSTNSNNTSNQNNTIASNPFGIRNPLSDYLNNTNINGASSHTISDTSKTTSIKQLINHYRATFMDFILDANLIELLQSSSNTINKDLVAHSYSSSSSSSDHKSTTATNSNQQHSICAQLSNIFSGNQMKFCLKHQELLETILPQAISMTKIECKRITKDLRWNCPAIDHLLDRNNPLAFTREAALVRSILNASMMYLVLKNCIEANHFSCGCQDNQRYAAASSDGSTSKGIIDSNESSIGSGQSVTSEKLGSLTFSIKQDFSPSDLTKLDAGTPIRLSKSITQRQGCIANIAFAYAFTKVFIDSDDSKALNRAHGVLNEDYNFNKLNKRANIKRLVDSDYRDLAFIKWTKAAINIHNNHLGRQVVRDATHRKCRCHGVSGVCQYQTCWDQLRDFDTISSKLRIIYLSNSTRTNAENLGSIDRPDLYLARSQPSTGESTGSAVFKEGLKEPNKILLDFLSITSNNKNSPLLNFNRVKPQELLYLYRSPDYCEEQPKFFYYGTKGRACALMMNNLTAKKTSKKNVESAADFDEEAESSRPTELESLSGAPGSCERLCCNRGFYSELVLDMITCNCRFKFCCKVECEQCLRQRAQHYCL